MSYAEDEGHDMGYWAEESYLERLWLGGFHEDRNHNEYKISEMTTEHLKNTINFFDGSLDTTPLEEELDKRKILRKS